MAVMNASDARLQFGPSRNFAGFGYNESYCDGKYPPDKGDQMKAWNAACKRGCSGFACVSSPGLAASPWTDVGKAARGLPNDSLVGSALSIIGVGAKPAVSSDQKKKKPTGNIFGDTSTLLLLGSVGLLGAAFYMKSRKGRSRSFGDFGSPKGRKHRGYSKRRYHGSKH
jgi:hypothetical protein